MRVHGERFVGSERVLSGSRVCVPAPWRAHRYLVYIRCAPSVAALHAPPPSPLYGWYRGELLAYWTTAMSPNGWTDATLGSAWIQINFEPHTRPSDPDQWRLLMFDGHNSHITWQFIHFVLAHRIICVCLFPHSTHLWQPLDVGVFPPFTSEYSKVYSIYSIPLNLYYEYTNI